MKFISIFLFFLSSCAYGPKTENKNTLSALNGKNYSGSFVAGPIIAVERKERRTHISGTVVFKQNDLILPLKYVLVQLKSENDKVLSSVTSDMNGEFSISDFLLNGKYKIDIVSDKFEYESTLDVNSYEIKDLVIEAKAKE